jgi:hypothetical protein
MQGYYYVRDDFLQFAGFGMLFDKLVGFNGHLRVQGIILFVNAVYQMHHCGRACVFYYALEHQVK